MRLERSYERTIAQLKREEQDEGPYFVEGGRIDQITDPTGCDENSRLSAAASTKPWSLKGRSVRVDPSGD